jgi:hypothetical protein
MSEKAVKSRTCSEMFINAVICLFLTLRGFFISKLYARISQI